MSFVCCSCKKTFSVNPSNVNGCGSFCASCENKRKKAVRDAGLRRSKKALARSSCNMCGMPFDGSNVYTRRDGTRDNICRECDNIRSGWVKKCIDYGPALFNYVSRHEQKTASVRDMRNNQHESQHTAANKTNETDQRISRIEGMMEKLIESLGGI